MIKIIKTRKLSDSKQRQSLFTASDLGYTSRQQETTIQKFSCWKTADRCLTNTQELQTTGDVEYLHNTQCGSLQYGAKGDTCHLDETS